MGVQKVCEYPENLITVTSIQPNNVTLLRHISSRDSKTDRDAIQSRTICTACEVALLEYERAQQILGIDRVAFQT